MRRESEKITDAIRAGKPPRRRRRVRLINLATLDMSEEEQAQQIALARARLAELGYRTDEYGRVVW